MKAGGRRGANEPPGDPIQRLALRLAGLGGAAALLALGPILGPWSPLPARPDAHARVMAFAFIGLLVLGFLMRILPRARGVALPHPGWARAGASIWAATAWLDALGIAPTLPLALLWGAGAVALGRALVGVWFAADRGPAWFEGWVAGGLLGMGGAVLALVVGAAFSPVVLARAPTAFLVAGAAPLTLGLAIRMLPPLSGVGPPDRKRAERHGRVASWAVAGACMSLLAGVGWLAALLLGGLMAAALSSLGWLGRRTDGDPASAAARDELAPRLLRGTARLAFGGLGLGLLALGLSGRIPQAPSASAHLVGLGFLAAMAMGVAQRIVPGFLAGELRWPRAAAVAPALLLLALVLRMTALWWPGLLGAASLALAAAWVVFALQIQPTLRSPDPGEEPRRASCARSVPL